MINRFFINYDTDRVPVNTDNKNLFKIDPFKCIEIHCTVSFDGMSFIFCSSFLLWYFVCIVLFLFQQIVLIFTSLLRHPRKSCSMSSRDYFHWAIHRGSIFITNNPQIIEEFYKTKKNIQFTIRSIFCFIHDFNRSYLMLQQRLLKNCSNLSD